MNATTSSKIQVFVADDHAVVRDGLRFVLEAQPDISVVGDASHGRQAVREILRLRPHVAVMDISMPGLNGIEAARQLQEQHAPTRVVFLTMHVSAAHIYRALQTGACGYVLKESAGEDIVAAVRAAFKGQRYLCKRITDELVADYLLRGHAGTAKSPVERLSGREREVLQLVVEGKTSAEIGATVHLSPKTVDTYRSRLMRKLEIRDVPSLVRFALAEGLTGTE